MTRKSKILLLALGCVVALALGEQTGEIHFAFSKSASGTGTSVNRKPAAPGDLASTIQVERPVTRWLPFVKFGETVHRRTYQDRAGNGVIYEHVVTTSTKLVVVGFCSTARYDEMANKPFENARKRYAMRR